MAPGTFEPCGVPGVLDLPLARRQAEGGDQRSASLARERLAVLGHHIEREHPIGLLAAAGEGPASIDAPAACRRLSRPLRLDRAGKHHVRAISLGERAEPFIDDLLVALLQ